MLAVQRHFWRVCSGEGWRGFLGWEMGGCRAGGTRSRYVLCCFCPNHTAFCCPGALEAFRQMEVHCCQYSHSAQRYRDSCAQKPAPLNSITDLGDGVLVDHTRMARKIEWQQCYLLTEGFFCFWCILDPKFARWKKRKSNSGLATLQTTAIKQHRALGLWHD